MESDLDEGAAGVAPISTPAGADRRIARDFSPTAPPTGTWQVRVDSSPTSDTWKAAVELSGADCCIGILALEAPLRRGTVFSSGCSRSDLAHVNVEGLRCWLEQHNGLADQIDQDMIDVDVREVAEVANLQWLKHLPMLSVGVVDVATEGVFWVLLGWRKLADGNLRDRRRLRLAMRVLAQSAANFAVGTRREKRLQILEGLIDELAPAFVLVDPEGRVFWTNDNAEEMLARRDLLIRNGGNRIASTTPAKTTMLREAITEVTRTHRFDDDGTPADRYLLLPRTRGDDDVIILRAVEGRNGLEGNRAVLLIVPQDESVEFSRRLMNLFGLIPSESRFVSALVETGSSASAAERLGITPQTAKTYLKRVYAKLGIGNQLELARMIASLTPPLRSRAGAIGHHNELGLL